MCLFFRSLLVDIEACFFLQKIEASSRRVAPALQEFGDTGGKEVTSIQWSIIFNWATKAKPGWLGYIGDYTTQLYRDYNKPL